MAISVILLIILTSKKTHCIEAIQDNNLVGFTDNQNILSESYSILDTDNNYHEFLDKNQITKNRHNEFADGSATTDSNSYKYLESRNTGYDINFNNNIKNINNNNNLVIDESPKDKKYHKKNEYIII